MHLVDVLILLLIPLSAIGGYRAGAISQVLGLAGFAIALTIVWIVAPHFLGFTPRGPVRAVVTCVIVILGLAVGYIGGSIAAKRVKAQVAPSRGARVDAVCGSILSISCLVLATWFLGVNLAAGPFESASAALRDSASVRSIGDSLPRPPQLMPALEDAAAHFGFPDLFVGLPPVPGPPVRSATVAEIEPAAEAGLRSTIEVLGTGCIPGFFNEGSGFVVAPGYVVTSAHVIAGSHTQLLYDGTRRYPARLVAIDPDRDVALLNVPTFTAQPMGLALEEVARGSGGAVVGFPGGFHPTTAGASVRGVIDVVARSIYGEGVVHRTLYELQVTVAPGDSGGPFVLPDGQAAGMVVYTSVLDATVAYAVPANVLAPIIHAGLSRREVVPSGGCTH